MHLCSLFRHCTTSRKVAGLITDYVIGIFNWHNPCGFTMVLESAQPLTKMSNANVPWGCKGGRCVGMTTLPDSCADRLEVWEPQTYGTLCIQRLLYLIKVIIKRVLDWLFKLQWLVCVEPVFAFRNYASLTQSVCKFLIKLDILNSESLWQLNYHHD
jgi:hypothetical protein